MGHTADAETEVDVMLVWLVLIRQSEQRLLEMSGHDPHTLSTHCRTHPAVPRR
jgi:hypothetical protein